MKEIAVLLDVGNTSTKIGLGGPKGLLGVGCVATAGSHGLPSCSAWVVQVDKLSTLAGLDPECIGAVVVSSVVPKADAVACELAGRLLVSPLFVPADLPLSIENHYEQPDEVGADRLVGAFAARRLHPDAELLVVVDFGTATTFDCVSGNAYLGGLICPGVLSSTCSLAEETAKLPKASLDIDPTGLHLGRSTLDSLNQGLVYGFAAMVEGLVSRIGTLLGGKPLVIATGGFAKRIALVCPAIDEVRGDLLVEGLRLAWVDSLPCE